MQPATNAAPTPGATPWSSCSRAIGLTVLVLAFFAVDIVPNAPQTFTAIVVIALLAVALDLVWKRSRGDLAEPDAPAA